MKKKIAVSFIFLIICFLVHSDESLTSVLSVIYDIPHFDFTFEQEDQKPLQDSFGLLEHQLSRDESTEWYSMLQEFKTDLYSQEVNAICFPNETVNAINATYFDPDPTEWENPTIYISKHLIEKSKTHGVSYIMRAIAEYIYWKRNRAEPDVLNRLNRLVFADEVQIRMIDYFNKSIGFPGSEFEYYLVSSFFDEEEHLNSQLYYHRCMDSSIIDDIRVLYSPISSLDDKKNVLNESSSRISKYAISGEAVIRGDDPPYNLNEYLRYVIQYSYLRYLEYYQQAIMNCGFDEKYRTEILDDFLDINNKLVLICTNELDDFLVLKSSFGERIFWYY